MRVFHTQRVLVYLELIAVLLLGAALLPPPLGSGPEFAPGLLAQPTRPRPTSPPRPPEPTPTWTYAPPTPTVPTPTPTRRPPTSTPTATYTPTSTPTPTATPDVLATLVARPVEPTPELEVAVPSGTLSLTFAQLGYGIVEMNRSRPTQRYIVELPGSFGIGSRDSHLLLTLHHFLESPEEPAALEVAVNGSAVHTIALDEPDLISRTVPIDIPQGLLRVGRNLIDLNLSTEAPCERPGNIANVWVDAASSLELRYELVPYAPDLSLYPHPFAEESVLRIPTTIVLSDRLTTDELSAAVAIAAGLGQGSGGMIELYAVRARDFDPGVHGHHHLIVIDRAGNNPLFAELALLPEIAEGTAGPGQGLLGLVTSPWDAHRLVLVVSGPDAGGLEVASLALHREVQALPAGTSVASFGELSLSAGGRTWSPWPHTTLASLGYDDASFVGSKLQSLSVDLVLPLGWPVSGPGLFVLRFTHAAGLDPDRSSLRVRLNGELIGSVALREDNASGGQAGLLLPADLLVPGRNRLELQAEMALPTTGRAECAYLEDGRLWTEIEGASEVLLPDGVGRRARSLRDFPYPFGRTLEPHPTLFVLPDEPSQAVLGHAVRLAARLGSPVVKGRAACQATTVSDVGSRVGWERHLILLGTTSEDVFGPALASYSVPWSEEGTITVGRNTVQLSPGRDLGILEIVDSPWNGGYGLLAVAGSSDEGLGLAVQALLGQPGSLEGDLAVIEHDPDVGEEGRLRILVADAHPPAVVPDATPAAPAVQARLAERWWK